MILNAVQVFLHRLPQASSLPVSAICKGVSITTGGGSREALKVNFALSILKYTVYLPLYLTQLSLLLRAVNKVCLLLSVKDSVVSNMMGGKLYISLYLEQNSPLVECLQYLLCSS